MARRPQLEDANRSRSPDGRYRKYAELEDAAGVVQTDTLTVVTGYRVARGVLLDPQRFSSNVLEIQGDTLLTSVVKRALDTRTVAKIVDPIPSVMRDPIVFQDGTRHEQAVRAIAPALGPHAINPLMENVRAVALYLLANHACTGEMDVIRDFAGPLTTRVALGLFGISSEKDAWIERQLRSTVVNGRGASFINGLMTAPVMAANQRALRSYFFDHVIDATPSAVTPLLKAVQERRKQLGDAAAFAEFVGLLTASTETTQNLIGSGMRILLSNKLMLDAVRRGAVSMPAFTQEVLRFDSPAQVVFRLTTEDVDLGGLTVPAGRRVAVVIGVANRDESIFPKADEFDVTRFADDGKHVAPGALEDVLSFGTGIHYCLGRYLARAVANIAWSLMLEHLAEVELTATALRTMSGFVTSGLEHLPVRFTPVVIDSGGFQSPTMGVA